MQKTYHTRSHWRVGIPGQLGQEYNDFGHNIICVPKTKAVKKIDSSNDMFSFSYGKSA